MKKILFFVLLAFVGCSNEELEDEAPVISLSGNPIVYTVTNFVENEVITLTRLDIIKETPTIVNVYTLKYGETSGKSVIDEDNGSHSIAFRTSVKQYGDRNSDLVSFGALRGDTVHLFLKKDDSRRENSPYYLEKDE